MYAQSCGEQSKKFTDWNSDGVRKMNIRIKLAWLFIGTTYIAAVCMVFFKCWPLHRQWQINPDPGSTRIPVGGTFLAEY
jgi:hypothetical protein